VIAVGTQDFFGLAEFEKKIRMGGSFAFLTQNQKQIRMGMKSANA
jgi:hypothetical protein